MTCSRLNVNIRHLDKTNLFWLATMTDYDSAYNNNTRPITYTYCCYLNTEQGTSLPRPLWIIRKYLTSSYKTYYLF